MGQLTHNILKNHLLISGKARHLYMALATFANEDKAGMFGYCRVSVAQLSEGIETHPKTTSRLLRVLRERGYIKIEKVGRENVYLVRADLRRPFEKCGAIGNNNGYLSNGEVDQ